MARFSLRLAVAVVTVVLLALCPAWSWAQSKNILLTPEEVAALPASGAAWVAMKTHADKAPQRPNLSDQDEDENVRTLARALVAVRLGVGGAGAPYKAKVLDTLRQVPETENGGRTLALGRKLGAYILAADLLGYREAAFLDWCRSVRDETLDGSTLRKKTRTKANNWSSSCIWSETIDALYLGDSADYASCILIYRNMLGDRTGFRFPASAWGCLEWQAHPETPTVITPMGSFINGHSMDGALPEELRRMGGGDCADFRWPPACENYVWSALEGLIGTGWVIAHNGNPDAWAWQDKALLRAVQWQHVAATCIATGNDTHLIPLVNLQYGSTFPAPATTTPGKIFGFGDWWGRASAVPPPEPPKDFQGIWDFHFDGATLRWVANRVDGEDLSGSGLTPDAALVDWLARNPPLVR